MRGKEWFVFLEDPNQKIIKRYNVFKNANFAKSIEKFQNKEISEHELKLEAKYCFQSKCEYEVIICGFPNEKTKEKVDVYKQLALNWRAFINYINSIR